MQRVQKLISASGYCSRRKAEQLITAGKVKVNGKVITIGDQAKETDKITVYNKPIKQQGAKHYYLLNKPVGYVTTCDRVANAIFELPALIKLRRETRARLYPVGRLDKNTSGLLILTNDGDFANHIMHPKFETKKSYMVMLSMPILKRDLHRIRLGVKVDDKKTWPALAQRLRPNMVRLTIHEGRNRIVRRMFKAINHKVVALERIAIGTIEMKKLGYGEIRKLTKAEVESLS
jgi:23S rRNA pseudouridine2605 synthase